MTTRPSLIFVSPHYGRGSGGVGTSCERIVGHLRLDYDLVVVYPDADLPAFSISKTHSAGLELWRFNGGQNEAASLQFLSDQLVGLMRERRFMALCSFYISSLAYAAGQAAAISKVPVVLLARGNDIDQDIFGTGAFRAWHTISHAHAVLCVSQELKVNVEAFCPGVSARYIPNGVDEVIFPALPHKPVSAKPMLGLFGYIKRKKNLSFLLEHLDFSSFDLKIVGTLDEESRKLLHGFLSIKPELAAAIQLVPAVADVPTLLQEYAAVDVVVIPSIHDGMPNVLLEAMSCGKIVVASDVGGAPDVIVHGENGFLFRSGDPHSFKAGLDLALEQRLDQACSVAANARTSIVTGFSAARERQRYLEFLAELSRCSP